MFADLSDEALVHRLLEAERELVAMRFKHSMNQLPNTASLRERRREIAQLRTEARARELSAGASKNALIARHRASFEPTPRSVASGGTERAGGFLSGIVDKLTGQN